MSTKPFDVPFDKEGNMLHDTGWVRDVEWREVPTFPAHLRYDGYAKGRSAMTFYWLDQNNHRYPMFLSDFDKLMKDALITRGYVSGHWSVVKRSGYFGIIRVEDPV